MLVVSGLLDEEYVCATSKKHNTVELKFVSPAILLYPGKFTSSMVSFSKNLDMKNATTIAREIVIYDVEFQRKGEDEMVPTSCINSIVGANHDYRKDYFIFSSSIATLLILRFPCH